MTAKYFIVTDSAGQIKAKPAEEVTARNVDAYLSIDQGRAEIVLAQADSKEQADRFIELLTKARAA